MSPRAGSGPETAGVGTSGFSITWTSSSGKLLLCRFTSRTSWSLSDNVRSIASIVQSREVYRLISIRKSKHSSQHRRARELDCESEIASLSNQCYISETCKELFCGLTSMLTSARSIAYPRVGHALHEEVACTAWWCPSTENDQVHCNAHLHAKHF